MGQAVSMEENALLKQRSAELQEIGLDNIERSKRDACDLSDDSASDSDMKTNSVRAAIDSLIESCLGVKSDDESTGKDDPPPKLIDTPNSDTGSKSPAVREESTVVTFMKDRIASIIRTDELNDDDDDGAKISSAPPASELTNDGCKDMKSTECDSFKVSACHNVPVAPKKEAIIPQHNTVRLQTLIDKVLDNSLGEQINNSLPEISSVPPVSSKPSVSVNPTKFEGDTKTNSDATETKRSPEIKCLQNRVVCLMDHIERVLENSFGNEENSSAPGTPPMDSHPIGAAKPPSGGGSITEGKPVTSVASTIGADGTISVQDIVNRVISQTEVISKLLSPNSKEEQERVQKENMTAASNSRRVHSEQAKEPERNNHCSPVTSGSKTVHGPHNDHNEVRMDMHRQWPYKHPHEVHPYQQRQMAEKVKEAAAGYQTSKYAQISKQNEALIAQHYGPRGIAPPYMNGAVPRAAMLQNAQMYMLRGHPMYMPHRTFPPPLMRADGTIATDTETPSFPHIPSKTCRCINCLTYFQLEEKSVKQNKPSPNSSSLMTPEAAFYQNHLQVPMHPHHAQGLVSPHDLARLQSTSPSKLSSHPVHMANMMQYQTASVVHPLKPVPVPAGISQGVRHAGNPFSLDIPKTDRRHERPIPHSRPEMYPSAEMAKKQHYHHKDDYSTAFENQITREQIQAARHHAQHGGRRIDIPHSNKIPPTIHQKTEDRFIHQPQPQSRPQPHPHHHSHPNPPHEVPVLDLTVKIPETSPIAQTRPTTMDTDQPLDLSKKPSQPKNITRYVREDGGGSVQINSTDLFNKSDNHHLQHLESSVDKFAHQTQGHGYVRRDMHAGERTNGLPCSAVMAPVVASNMVMSPGGHRPQLHPIPAPTFSTSTAVPALSPIKPGGQVSTSHAQSSTPYLMSSQEIMSPKLPTTASGIPQSGIQQCRESPQPLASPVGSDKGDNSQRRGSISRHEPIQSIIGNHPPNDILYLICRLCRQTYGSPYGFRKHFRNQHGFEPRAEHTIVQTISATKSAMQGPYTLGPHDQHGDHFIPTGRSSAPLERENSSTPGSDYFRSKKESLSPVTPRGVSPCMQSQDWANGKGRVYRRASEGRPRSALREDADDVKYLECQECKQTFQLNDFGSYKRHCRQHHQARAQGPFVGADNKTLSESDGQIRTVACRFCGGHFPHVMIEEHVKSVHFKELNSESPNSLSRKSSVSTPNSPEGHAMKSRVDSNFTSTSEFQKYMSEPLRNPNLEIQRLPADQITVSASPDSSSDKAAQSEYAQPSSNSHPPTSTCVPDTNSDCVQATPDKTNNEKDGDSATPESKSKDLQILQVNFVEDDKDSGFSGERCSSSESRSLSIESAQDGGSQASPAEADDPHAHFYRHKKFQRKRKESCEASEPDAKFQKLDQSNVAALKDGASDSPSEGKSDSKAEGSEAESVSASNEADPAVQESQKKPKPEARHQLPFVWDRVTRIQAGKNIKPPDYMT